MRRGLLYMFLSALLLTGCNLSDRPAGEDAAPTIPAGENLPAIPTLSSGTPPPVQPTRTPFGAPPTALPILLTANPSGNAAAPVVTLATGERAVISAPTNGTVVSSPITLSGTITDVQGGVFTLQVLDSAGNELARQRVSVTAPVGVREASWSASVSVGAYLGAAQARVVIAAPAGREAVLAVVDVIVQRGAILPGGGSSAGGTSMGSISAPVAGSTVMGDPLQVAGMAGNFPETTFTLGLYTASGVLLNSQTITLTGAEAFVVPWSASMGTGGYRGAVELRAFVLRAGAEVAIARVSFTLG